MRNGWTAIRWTFEHVEAYYRVRIPGVTGGNDNLIFVYRVSLRVAPFTLQIFRCICHSTFYELHCWRVKHMKVLITLPWLSLFPQQTSREHSYWASFTCVNSVKAVKLLQQLKQILSGRVLKFIRPLAATNAYRQDGLVMVLGSDPGWLVLLEY